jgi:hypothetical protein
MSLTILIVDNNSVFLKQFLSFRIKITGNFMNLIFLFTLYATHPNAPTLAQDLEFSGAFFTFHGHQLNSSSLVNMDLSV